ncbi:MAG: rhomboid family intramembrane serine protease [Myxococcota bacterium]|nr:rhomboid family intramembrane serine protease [Myxococcota bacterium]
MKHPLPSFDALVLRDKLLQARVGERFEQHLRRLPPVTTALVAACVVLHLATGGVDWATGQANWAQAIVGQRSAGTLLLFGAREHGMVASGEYWRLLSCIFLHGDGLHILLNGLALFGLGRLCEAVWGGLRMAAIFLFAGLCGSLLSQAGGTELSVGASGGVFGLLGAGVVFGLRAKDALPPGLRRVFGRGLAPWIVINLAIGLFVPRIDNLGHLGGLFGGVLIAPLLADRVLPGSQGYSWVDGFLGVGMGAVLAGTAAQVIRELLWVGAGIG